MARNVVQKLWQQDACGIWRRGCERNGSGHGDCRYLDSEGHGCDISLDGDSSNLGGEDNLDRKGGSSSYYDHGCVITDYSSSDDSSQNSESRQDRKDVSSNPGDHSRNRDDGSQNRESGQNSEDGNSNPGSHSRNRGYSIQIDEVHQCIDGEHADLVVYGGSGCKNSFRVLRCFDGTVGLRAGVGSWRQTRGSRSLYYLRR
jgi:hypothetical protein